MNKNIFRIALTGGPCAGKTTALARIIERFSALDYLVYALPETPTLFSNASINFCTPDKRYFYNIEKAVLKYQIQMEDTFLELAHSAPKPVILISDRGTMDISAYMEPMIWQALLDELGLSDVKLRDARYDAVIHMVSAAVGAEEFYGFETNSARYENVDEARDLDARILKAWTGHPHLHIVANDLDFNLKVNNVVRLIQNFVGIDCTPDSDEIRRKFLVSIVGDIPYGVEMEIYQTYITNELGDSTRIRKRGQHGNYIYSVSQKHAFHAQKQNIITERQISPDEYLAYLSRINPQRDEVTTHHFVRKSFVWAGQYFELDRYIEEGSTAHILEIKLSPAAHLKLPPFIELIAEVTNNPTYERL